MTKPPFVTKAMLTYLDRLRESGVTNMYGGAPYLRRQFPRLTDDKASAALSYWMRTFSERHP